MRKSCFLLAGIALLLAGKGIVNGQDNFDPVSYKAYLEANKSLTADQLLAKYPPQTTYYSSRDHLADLGSIPWFDSINSVYNLTGYEKSLLKNNFFVVTERLPSKTWVGALVQGYNNDLPLFLSSDFILYTLHNSYDNILMNLERQLLEPNLKELLDALYAAFPALNEKYSADLRLSDPLKDVDLYVSIARSLAYGENYYPQAQTKEKFNEIMGFIEQEEMNENTILFTETKKRKIDFSQFTPRGHYTREFWEDGKLRTLGNYFRAMMWLGRIDFLLTAPPENPWEENWTDDQLRRMQQGAVLLNELLHSCGKKPNLDLHEKIITFMVGPDDNLTPDELGGLTSRMLSSPAELFNAAVYEAFKDSLNASDDYGQKIMSNYFFVDPFTSDPGKLPVSFKLLGQKFLIDSYIFSEVVFDRIVVDGFKVWRGLPDPLDAMAVLGNEDALALLEEEMEEYQYAYKVDALKYLVDAYDEDFWNQSLYNNWLAAIRELNPPSYAGNLPYFMQTTAWHQEKLNTQLCSWAELRHDNILYGKQSYTGGTACSFPYTYVEPYPGLYSRIGEFARHTADFFREINQENNFPAAEGIFQFYETYTGILEKLEEISKKELAGTPLSEAEITWLKTMINFYMASGPSVDGWLASMFYDQETGMNMDFVVADVHTQPSEYMGPTVGKVLHVGNGLTNRGVFLASNPMNPGQIMAFTGPVASFHYDVTLDFKRYTDEEWRDKFLDGDLPPRPDWVQLYLAGQEGNALPEGRKLKGDVYSGSQTDPSLMMNTLDYLLAYPNPAREELHLRFVLNRRSRVNVQAYDASGRLVKEIYSGILMPAEHDLPIDVSGWQRGIYILNLGTGDNTLFKKVFLY